MENDGPTASDGSKEQSCPSPVHSNRQNLQRTLKASDGGKLQPLAIIGTAVKLEVKPLPSNDESQAAHSRIFMPSIEEDIDINCLLVADSTVECAPLHLRQLLLHFDPVQLTTSELLLLLIYTVSLELGYCTQQEYAMCRDHLSPLTACSAYHSRNVLHMTRLAPTYSHAAAKTHFTMHLRSLVNLPAEPPSLLDSLLSGFATGDFMIVTLTPDRSLQASGSSICLSIGRYVLASGVSNRPLHQRFRKLDELAGLLRAELFVTMRNRQLETLQASIYPSLLGLPAEMYEEIFSYLSQNQLNILANVCKHLHYHSTNSKYMKAKKT